MSEPLTITKGDNGFKLGWYEEVEEWEYLIDDGRQPVWHELYFEDSESDPLISMQHVLWEVLEFFGMYGSKHEERLRIVREMPDGKIKEG